MPDENFFTLSSECDNASDRRVLKLPLCTKPKREAALVLSQKVQRASVLTRTIAVCWNYYFVQNQSAKQRAGSACRVPRAETKAFQQAKARNSVQLQAGVFAP